MNKLNLEAVNALINQYRELVNTIKALEEEKKALGAQFLEALRDAGINIARLTNGTVKEVTRTTQRLDTKRLLADHPELVDQYMVTTTSTYLDVR